MQLETTTFGALDKQAKARLQDKQGLFLSENSDVIMVRNNGKLVGTATVAHRTATETISGDRTLVVTISARSKAATEELVAAARKLVAPRKRRVIFLTKN